MINMEISSPKQVLMTPNRVKNVIMDSADGSAVIVLQKEFVVSKDSFLEFPATGEENTIYIDTTANKSYRWNPEDLHYYVVGSDYNDIKVVNGGDASE